MYRQGDVLLVSVEKLPEGGPFKTVHPDGGRQVLALGEATGHAHVLLAAGLGVTEVYKDRYVTVPKVGGRLTHEEHGPIEIPEGLYRVALQREYTPKGDVNVAD